LRLDAVARTRVRKAYGIDDMMAEVPYLEPYPARARCEITRLDHEVKQPW